MEQRDGLHFVGAIIITRILCVGFTKLTSTPGQAAFESTV